MVLLNRCDDVDESMSQIVPSAGFTPPCDYSNFADTFDLSLLPGGEQASTYNLYGQINQTIPKIYANFYPSIQTSEKVDTQIELGPDFQKLLAPSKVPTASESLYLEVPTANNYHANSPIGAIPPHSPNLLSPHDFNVYHPSDCYPSSPELSLYNSPSAEDYTANKFIKQEHYSVGSHYYPENEKIQLEDHNVFNILGGSLLDKQIKQESTVDFGNLLKPYTPQLVEEKKTKVEDHQLLREVLRDTSFQKKFNLKEINFDFDIKMEEPETHMQKDMCADQLEQGDIEPMLQLAITQVRKDIDSTCTALKISQDPTQWTQENVLSWLQWTSREFNLPVPEPVQWEISGASLVCLVETDFIRKSPQGGATLYAQLEIWKTAYLEDDLNMVWLPDATSNASSGEVSDDEDEEIQLPASETKPATATTNTISTRSSGGSHIHLWQFLKELLAASQLHGSCIRWLDRGKGVFKIEDSVRVARLWGKRKNRPAMNYDKLSRSIRQYYKKGIMKKTERSQRLVYQFCHPYCL